MSDARRAGRAFGRRRQQAEAEDPYAPELEWPALRRAILAKGGIGPSPDYDRDRYPGDLYREHGLPPDVMAEELTLGRADVPPWGQDAGDDGMMRYLERAHNEWERNPERRHSIADPELAARRRALKEGRDTQLRHQYGTIGKQAHEQAAHNQRMADFIAHVRRQRANQPRANAIGFYTDRKDVVHPITAARGAGRRYAMRRGK